MKKVYVFPQPLVMTYFLFTFYKHRRKKIAAVILKPIIEVTLSTRYIYENFWLYDNSDRANLRFFVRSFVNSVTHVLKNLRTRNLRTETGVQTFLNSTPGSEDQYAPLYAKLHQRAKFRENRLNRGRNMAIFDFSKIAAVRHLGFVMRVWGPPTKGIWWSLSLCKIWLDSMS